MGGGQRGEGDKEAGTKKVVAKRQGRRPMRRRGHRDMEGLLGMDGDMTGSFSRGGDDKELPYEGKERESTTVVVGS